MNALISQTFPVGQILATSRLIYWHIGIVTDHFENDEQVVISCSLMQGKVVEEPMSVFAQGFQIEVRQSLSPLATREVLRRARSQLGSAYDLFQRNCEHFVYYSFGLTPQSPQMARFIALAALGLAFKQFA